MEERMALLSDKDQKTLKDLFGKRLTEDVNLTYFTQHDSVLSVPGLECEYCRETRDLLEEVSALSDHIHVTIKDFVKDEEEAKRMGVERIPAIVMEGKAKGRVNFYGIPAGYEFSTLIEDLLDLSSGEPDLQDTTLKAMESVQQDVHIQVFVTPT
jgi:glutaredoxin-like protein